jgi:hypothetical protein
MADGYNNADYAFTLPNYFPAPGQVLQSAIARQDKQAEFDYENKMRAMQAAQKKAEDDRMKNLGVLSKETEFGTQYATPDLQVNSITQKNLQRIKNKGYELIGQSPESFNNWINSEVSKVAQWNNMAKTDATNIKERQKEINSTYQNIDINKANSLVSKSFLENYTQVNPETGELEIKETSSVVPNKNYFEQFDNPKNLASIVTDVSPFYGWFPKVQSSQTGDSQSVSKNGVINKESWTGYVTPYTKVDFDEKGKPFISVTSVSMPYTNPVTGKTESMPIADDALMTDVMAKPDTKIAAYKAWEDEKAKRKVDYKDPAIDEIMFKNFIYNTANRLLPHEVKTQEATKTPVINISTGDVNKGKESNFVNGLTDAINSGNKRAVEDYFGKFPALEGGRYTYSTYSDITNRKTGEPVEYLVYLKDSDGVELPEPISLKRNDKDLFSKVAGTYQKLGGSSKNIELEAIDKPSPKPAPKKEPTEAQFAAAARLSGMTIEEYKKAYKASQKK